MSKFRLSEEAETDLQAIWDYIAKVSIKAADGLLAEIYDVIISLSEMPGMGRARDELAVGLRSFPVGNYVIFYRRMGDVIEIAHVLHGARNMNSIAW